MQLPLSMNYLAHAYLSFNNSPVLLGNMISDFVKGKKQFDYPGKIQTGIRLHREIDNFTDLHDATRQLKSYFKPTYRLYAGAFADVVYDYFLANDPKEFLNDDALFSFTENTYRLLDENSQWFGDKFGHMFPYMQNQNWLYNYQFDWGIQKSLEGVRRRAAYIAETETAFANFVLHKKQMQECYELFFPDVKKFAADTLTALLTA